MKNKNEPKMRYWMCIIGDTIWDELPPGADLPMRSAVSDALLKTAGHGHQDLWSGWSPDEKTVKKLLKLWSKQEIENATNVLDV